MEGIISQSMSVKIEIPCLSVFCYIVGCTNVSSVLNPSEQQRASVQAPSTSVNMALDYQESYQNVGFKCFYIPVSTSTSEQLGVTLHSKECPEQIQYDYTKGNWQIAE